MAAHLSPVLTQATPVVVDHAHGSWIHGTDGRDYLDFTTGIGVTSTGHCHPDVVAAADGIVEWKGNIMNWNLARGLVYLACLAASGLAMAGLADFDLATGSFDLRPFNLYANHFCVIQFYSEIIILGIAQKHQLWQHSSKLSLTSRARSLIYCSAANPVLPCIDPA